MQDEHPNATSGAADWRAVLEQSRAQLKSQRMTRALDEVLSIADSPSAAWLDTSSSDVDTMYVLQSPTLHRITGSADPPKGLAQADIPSDAGDCEYRSVPVTREARYSLSLTRAPDRGWWTFEVPGFERFTVPAEGDNAAAQFARSLAREIANASAARVGS